MTREEAIKELKEYEDGLDLEYATPFDKAILYAIKVMEQEPILDKIRAEIKTKYDSIPWRNNDYDDGWVEALEWVYDDVIDKYKAETEAEDGNVD